MICKKCLKEITDDVDICPNCGNPVEKDKNSNTPVNNNQIINNSMDEFINEANNKIDSQTSDNNFINNNPINKSDENIINPQMDMLNNMKNTSDSNQENMITTEQALNEKSRNEIVTNKSNFPKIIIWLIVGIILGVVVYFTIYPAIIKASQNSTFAHNWCCQTSNSGSNCDMSLVLGDDDSFSLTYNDNKYTGKYFVKKSSKNIDNDNKSYYTLKLDRFDSNDDFTYAVGTSSNKMVIYENDTISKTLYCFQN